MSITFSKTDERCLKCEHFDDCDNKRMVMCAMAELPLPEQYAEKATETVSMPLANDICVKHDYRQIKIAPNTTVTIDLEEEKKKLQEELTKHLRCDFSQWGV
jgi:hypothetical protein